MPTTTQLQCVFFCQPMHNLDVIVVGVLVPVALSYLEPHGFSENLARYGLNVDETPVKCFVWLYIVHLVRET